MPPIYNGRIPASQVTTPISPRSVGTLLAHAELDLDTAARIATGLIQTIKDREAANAARDERLKFLEERFIDEEEPSPAPDGYHRNVHGYVPDLYIPVGEGYQRAYWVRQLPCGRVASFPRNYKIDDEPFISEIYATPIVPDQGDEQDNSGDGLIFPTPPWLLQMLKGTPNEFGILRQALTKIDNWGLTAEVRRFRELEHHRLDMQHRLDVMHAEQRALREAQEQCQARLEAAQFNRKVAYLRRAQPSRNDRTRADWRFMRREQRVSN